MNSRYGVGAAFDFLDTLIVLAKHGLMSIVTESSEIKSRIQALEIFSKELRGYL